MKHSAILWQTPSRFERVIGFVLQGPGKAAAARQDAEPIPLDDFLSLENKPEQNAQIRLGKSHAYVHEFDGKSVSAADLKKIAANELRRLTPLVDGDETILARQAQGRPNVIEFLHVRNELIDTIESRSRALGLADFRLVPEAGSPAWTPPSQHLAQTRETRLMAVALCCLVASVFAFLAGADTWLARSNETALQQERQLRAQLMEREASERETGALGRIASMQPDRRSPSGRLSALAALTENTPQNAWWSEVELNGTAIRLTGNARNAAETLTVLTNAYPDQSVRFTQPVSTRPDGREGFVITIEGRDE